MDIRSGQIVLSSTPQPLTATPLTPVVFEFRARVGNSGRVYWGGPAVTTSTGYDLEAGEVYTIERHVQALGGAYDIGMNAVYFVGTTGDVVSWVAFL